MSDSSSKDLKDITLRGNWDEFKHEVIDASDHIGFDEDFNIHIKLRVIARHTYYQTTGVSVPVVKHKIDLVIPLRDVWVIPDGGEVPRFTVNPRRD